MKHKNTFNVLFFKVIPYKLNYHQTFAVAYAQKELCTGPLEVKASLGYLSSRVAEQNGCGTLDSPWFVTVQPGQQIQFTLMDFGGLGPTQHSAGIYVVK